MKNCNLLLLIVRDLLLLVSFLMADAVDGLLLYSSLLRIGEGRRPIIKGQLFYLLEQLFTAIKIKGQYRICVILYLFIRFKRYGILTKANNHGISLLTKRRQPSIIWDHLWSPLVVYKRLMISIIFCSDLFRRWSAREDPSNTSKTHNHSFLDNYQPYDDDS